MIGNILPGRRCKAERLVAVRDVALKPWAKAGFVAIAKRDVAALLKRMV